MSDVDRWHVPFRENRGLAVAVFEELAGHIRYWSHVAARELEEQGNTAIDNAQPTVGKAMEGLVHTILVMIDGGTALSDRGRCLALVDQDGFQFLEGMHEHSASYMPSQLTDTTN